MFWLCAHCLSLARLWKVCFKRKNKYTAAIYSTEIISTEWFTSNKASSFPMSLGKLSQIFGIWLLNEKKNVEDFLYSECCSLSWWLTFERNNVTRAHQVVTFNLCITKWFYLWIYIRLLYVFTQFKLNYFHIFCNGWAILMNFEIQMGWNSIGPCHMHACDDIHRVKFACSSHR